MARPNRSNIFEIYLRNLRYAPDQGSLRPFKYCFESRQEFAWAEWFGDVVISSGGKAFFDVRFTGSSGDQHDGQGGSGFFLAQLCADFEAGHLGHGDIQQDQARHFPNGGVVALFPILGDDDLVTCRLELHPDQLTNMCVVVNYENFHRTPFEKTLMP